MAQRMSLAEQVSRNDLAVAGAKTHAAKLPKEVKPIAASLAKRNPNILALNAKQEKLKQELAALTAAINAELTAASRDRAKIIKAAEFTFGAQSLEIKMFRPVTEGRG